MGSSKSRLIEVEALPQLPSPNSIAIMASIDAMPKQFRSLVYEYGFVIVREMLAFGAHDARDVERELKTWRRRRQDDLLR